MAAIKLTDQQKAIIDSRGNIKINAVAGSGKTQTLIEYARYRQTDGRILYIAFNRSVRLEAQKRFEQAGLTNVDVQTAHSLAFREIVPRSNYKISTGYKLHEIANILGLTAAHNSTVAYILATHIQRLVTQFCALDSSKVDQIDYLSTITDTTAKDLARKGIDKIVYGARRFLAMMDRGEIPVTHEFYLKKFQLSQPTLPYRYILFDEGQDASPVMLDIFNRQQTGKVIVGDAHQQIYSWRYAVNALQSLDFKELPLTTSFRFGQNIADLAMEVLKWKKNLGIDQMLAITGAGKPPKKIKTHATLARSNLFLLRAAIHAISYSRSIKKLYFEGNLNSYTYASEGASIYDVINLYNDHPDKVRDPVLKEIKSFEQLEEFAEQSDDQDLTMLIDIVNEYGNELLYLLKQLKEMHVSDENREKADMIFSTVHRCKGLEYDHVALEEDFITEEKLKRFITKKDEYSADRLLEEINVLYVALTRTRNQLKASPDQFNDELTGLYQQGKSTPQSSQKKQTSQWLDKTRVKAGNAYKPWSSEDDLLLERLFYKGTSPKELASRFNRKQSAIYSRLRKLGVVDD